MTRIVVLFAVVVALVVAMWVIGSSTIERDARTPTATPDAAPDADPSEAARRVRDAASPEGDDEPTPPPCLRVLVTDADGRAVPGASLRVDDPSTEEGETGIERTATTDAEGRASVDGLVTGRWRVRADAPGWAHAIVDAAWVEGDPAQEVRIVLERGHGLEVSVRDAEDTPQAGFAVEVRAVRHGEWKRVWTSSTDSSGRCRLVGLPRGTVYVSASLGKRSDGTGVVLPALSRVDLRVAVATPDEAAPAPAEAVVRIKNELGDGVEGAHVEFHVGFPAYIDEPVATGTSAGDGTCRILPTEGRDWMSLENMVVRATGYATLHRRLPFGTLRAGDSKQLPDLVLAREARLEGRVLGPDGPIAGAEVTAWVPGHGPFGLREAVKATSDATGAYAIGGLSPCVALVGAEAPGFVQPEDEFLLELGIGLGPRGEGADGASDGVQVAVVAGEVREHDINLVRTDRPSTIRVTIRGVVRTEDGSPVPWADVWASGSTKQYWIANAGDTIANAEGRFELVAEAEKGFRVWAAAHGLHVEDAIPVPMAESGTREGVEVVLERRPVVRGTVTSRLGLPVEGGRITIGTRHALKFNDATFWNEQPAARIAADGTYEVPLEVGPWGGSDRNMRLDDMVVLVEVDGHAPRISEPFEPDDLVPDFSIDLELDEGATVTGRVVDDTGAPLAGVQIARASRVGYNTDNWPPTEPPCYRNVALARSDEDGRFRIAGLMPGRHWLRVAERGFVEELRQVEAPDDQFEFVARRSLRLAGHVLAPDGAPLADAYLRLIEPGDASYQLGSAHTSTDGSFSFVDVPAGEWMLEIRPDEDGPDVRPASVRVSAGNENLQVHTQPGLALGGTLLDASGKPLVGVEIRAAAEDPDREVRSNTTTDADGRFRFVQRPPGTHRLRIYERRLSFERVELGSEVVLRMPGNLTIELQVVDAARENRPHVGVYARRIDTPPGQPVAVHQAEEQGRRGGRFTLTDLAPGRYALEVQGGVYSPRRSFEWRLESPVEVSAGTTGLVVPLELVDVTGDR